MQSQLLVSTRKDKMYLFFKYLFEVSICIFLMPLFLLVYIYLFIKNKIFLKKSIFINKYVILQEDTKFKYFNISGFFLSRLPLIFNIIKAQIYLVGTATYCNDKIGVFSLWQIRKNIKMSNQSEKKCDEEYLEKRGFFYDIKILLKAFFALIFQLKNPLIKQKVMILDINFLNTSLNKLLDSFKQSITKNEKEKIFFINAHCLNLSVEDNNYKKALQNAHKILPDGSGINLACNILNTPLKENLNGTDLLPHLCELSQENAYNIYLLGAKEGIALKMKENLEKEYPNLNIVGVSNGFFKDEEKLIKDINSKNVDILLVALGVPNQELFIEKNYHKINAKLQIGVGGLFDFYSNKTKRAPLFLRELGLEWIYRMIQEPKRMWKRYIIGNPKFIFRVWKDKKKRLKSLNRYLNVYENKNLNIIREILIWKIQLKIKTFIKRVCDIVFSAILLILLSPIFLLVAIIIRFESKGAIFFSQNRVGENCKIFKMYKFRSMVENAEDLKEQLQKQNESKDGVIFKMKDDPRITKFGKFIRKTSIDELPQLFNVLIGDMSLVGPRPPVISEVKLYDFNDRKRLDVKPGITCIWQVSGRSKIPFKEQVELDKQYIKDQSFYKDVSLLLKTIPAVVFSKGAY